MWARFALSRETSADVSAAFVALKGRLRDAGTLDRTDPSLVLLAARLTVTLDRAWLDIERDGTTLPTNNGMQMAHPMLSVLANHGSKLRGLLAGMGLEPSSSKLTAAKPKEGDNPWADLLSVTG